MKVLGSDFYTHGIVPVDIKTRLFRLRGQGQTTIFIVPDIEKHPALTHAREMENHPNVVSVDNTLLAHENAEVKDTIAVQEAALRESGMKVKLYKESMVGGERVSSAAMIRQITALADKLEILKTVLPEEYHQHLGMESKDRTDGMACTDGMSE
ncbi:Uncharacterized protein TPAR_03707 [Tolypocladium paradoxum]|uniref:Uncharacterized protein n=1 Tax=Tolypocladium paradoxum TaxID=94208 RepID=A0A2S4L0V9_9HYPO|nr:Uncharacterized protein TPAR_03707 [Tolypocladium paradoxum]